MTTSTVDFVMRGLELKHSETGKQKPQIKKFTFMPDKFVLPQPQSIFTLYVVDSLL